METVPRILPVLAVLTALAVAAGEPTTPLGGTTKRWSNQVHLDLGESEYHFNPTPGGEGHSAPNRAHDFRIFLDGAGVRVVSRTEVVPTWELGLTLVNCGRGAHTRAVGQAAVEAQANRIEYRRDGIEEWYVNEPKGLEQGFVLSDPPEGAPHGSGTAPAFLSLALSGSVSPRLSEDGRSIDFLAPTGAAVVRYSAVVVTDAVGHVLKSWIEGFNESGVRGIRLLFDDADAVYPVTVDPLLETPTWAAESDQAGAQFGQSVATAGDVNGDGYSDVIVAAPLFDNGGADKGRVYVFHGSASGLQAIPAWTAEGDQVGARLGTSVATAGDVNGDGYADVIVGARGYSNGEANEGRVYVFHGSAAGLEPAAAWVVEGDQPSTAFGGSVATAGDVNGDGFSDVVVGAALFDNDEIDEGRAFVFHGSASGLESTPAWTAESDQAGATFGVSVATAGDVNGDGYADVIVGASRYDNGQVDEGRVYVYHGSASGLAASPAWTKESNQASASFGASVATVGDVTADGYSDVIIGAPLFDDFSGIERGMVFVYYGAAPGLAVSPAWTTEGTSNSLFGASVATAGDLNGDGKPDVIVGSTGIPFVWVYLNPGWGLSSDEWLLPTTQAGSRFGCSVATAGDVNGDGYSDMIIGADAYDNAQTDEGAAFVYHGSAAESTKWFWAKTSDQAFALFGISVATAGDVNGDGYSDVIAGAQQYDNGTSQEGRAVVYHGSASGPAALPSWEAEGNNLGALFGASVASAGDVNGDGYSDVAVGAPLFGPLDYGRVFVFHGSAAGLATTPAWTAQGDQTRANFGKAVATGGDVNGDGYSDLVVGAYEYDGDQIDEGRVFVYHGSAAGLSPSPVWMLEGNQAGGRFGVSVATAGDVNGDGYSDLIVGADDGNIQGGKGRARVYHGSAVGLQTTPAWTAESDQAGSGFGHSVATAGDVNGDGYSDVIVGAYGYDNGQTDEGRSFVYHGSAAGLQATPAWTAESNNVNASFGYSVATAGDIDAEGHSDVIVGAPLFDNGSLDGGRVYGFNGSAGGLATSPSWTVGNGDVGAEHGHSVATAGDVNGDGFSDVIIGAPFIGGTDQGLVGVATGNGATLSVGRIPRQSRADDLAPIDLLGRSDSESSFRLKVRGAAPAGRCKVRLQWEVEPLGTAFDGQGLGQGPLLDTGAPSGSGSVVELNSLVQNLAPGPYHWRLRILSNSPFFPRSIWLSLPYNGRTETDIRVPCLSGAPPEVVNLRVYGGVTGTTLEWDATGAGVRYDVVSGLTAELPVGAGASETCLATGIPETTVGDTSDPGPGQSYWYLVRAWDGCGVGTYGSDSDGQARLTATCP